MAEGDPDDEPRHAPGRTVRCRLWRWPCRKEQAMPGIVVGVDGSANARYALEWAIEEAAGQNAPLTRVAVNEGAASFWTGNPGTVPAGAGFLDNARNEGAAVTEHG